MTKEEIEHSASINVVKLYFNYTQYENYVK